MTGPQADATETVIAENADKPVDDGWQYVMGRMNTKMNENVTDADELGSRPEKRGVRWWSG